MEKKRNSCPVEKFFKSFRPIRGNPNPSSPSASNNPNIVKTHHHHTPKYPKPNIVAISEVVPVKFDYSTPQKNGGKVASVAPNKNNMEAVSQFVQAKKIASKHKATRMESNNNKMNANIEEDEFTKYIKRAWNQIRTPSSFGGGKNVNVNVNTSATATGGEDTGKDQFSDYINRAKKRMLRNMSSFVGGRNDSMK